MRASGIKIITELGEISGVNRRCTILGADFALDETAEAFARIAREIGFTNLTIVDDVDAAVELFLDDFDDSAAYPLGENSFVDGLAGDFCLVHLFQVGRLRQGAGVGRENSFRTALHFFQSSIRPTGKLAGLKICALKKRVKQENKSDDVSVCV